MSVTRARATAASRSSSHRVNTSSGSMVTVSGTKAAANGSGRSGSSRTASFSVVRTAAAPVWRTRRGDGADVGAG